MRTRYLISCLLLLPFIAAFHYLGIRLISQVHYLKATHHLRDGYHGLAISRLEKALHYQENDPTIWNLLGRTYHGLGNQKSADEAFLFAKKAKHAYLKAARLNPLDAEAAYGLARQEARLERLYPYFHPNQNDNPHHAFPYFQEAIRLRPNGINRHYALARYLWRQGKTEAFLQVVTNLARIYPLAYGHLKKQVFWSSQVKDAVQKGLEQAAEEEIATKHTHIAISSLRYEERDLSGAISHYEKAVELDPQGTTHSESHFHLGRLYLENEQVEEAEDSFLRALSLSQNREKDLERVYGVYKNKGYSGRFCRFYHRVSTTFPVSARIDILLARSLIDLKQYDEAKRILKDLDKKEANAEGYYWLFRIAQEEKDWDNVELSIQKATVLEPRNSRYHLLFSQVLKQLKKLDRAEREAGLAIKHAARPSVSLFNHRASIRWSKKDYQGAAEDWKSAIALKPKNPSLYARVGEAHKNLGEWSLAIEHYQKAVELAPDNKNYKKTYEALRASHHNGT